MTTIANPSVIDLGNGNRWFHLLLPQQQPGVVDLSIDRSGVPPPNAPLEGDITLADLGASGATSVTFTKASLTIRGPQIFNMGELILLMEDTDQSHDNFIWSPLMSVADGQYRATDSWNPGVKMLSSQQICWEYINRPYSGFNPSAAYGGTTKRSMWVDLFYHIG